MKTPYIFNAKFSGRVVYAVSERAAKRQAREDFNLAGRPGRWVRRTHGGFAEPDPANPTFEWKRELSN
jgi:hypothetical protein